MSYGHARSLNTLPVVDEPEHLNQDMYRNLLVAAYEDGIITDMERTLLDGSSKQLGLTPDGQGESKMKSLPHTSPERRALSKFFCTR